VAEELIADNPINDTQAEVLGGGTDAPEITASLTDQPAVERSDEGAVGPASLEEAELFASGLGETSFESQGVSVDISLGSSFSTESSALGGGDTSEASTDSTAVRSEAPDNSASLPSSSPVTAGTSTAGGRNVSAIPTQEAVQQSATVDASRGQAALDSLTPEASASGVKSPSPQQIQQSLQNAADQIRRGAVVGGQAMTSPSADGLQSSIEGLGVQVALNQSLALLAANHTASIRTDAPSQPLLPPSFNRARYNPAILHIRFTDDKANVDGTNSSPQSDAFLDLTLMPSQGDPVGLRVALSRQEFSRDLKALYRQLSRQESLDVQNPKAPSRRLYDAIFAAVEPELKRSQITTLLISADRGLQAVPFAALHNGEHYFGDSYAFAITPSLALTSLAPPLPAGGRLLAVGAAVFDGLAPLPLVPVELNSVSSVSIKDIALNQQFVPRTLLEEAADPRYSRVHVATHAEFLPGGPAKSKLYSGTVPIPLSDMVKLRLSRQEAPLDLISFSACRTALGDADSELGFAGLALQAGARSAVGTLWYVDDVATSAYFVQLYRYLDAGVPKAESLQLTRQAFARGLVRLQGDAVVGPDDAVLISRLTTSQKRRASGGFSNPYFWAGIELLGSAW
jgi:CHAT domain-containing protein